MYHLQTNDGSHQFTEGATFNEIIQHYKFDKELRIIIKKYLERIEISIRARLTDYFSVNHGFFWYSDRDLYADLNTFDLIESEIIQSFGKRGEKFLRNFKNKYTSEGLPPSNMAMELLSFGKISRLYKGLKNDEEKRRIANDFNLPSIVLSSWLVYLNDVRNICAHHGRLWNRKITANKPKIPSRKDYKFKGAVPSDFNSTLYGVVSLIDRLLRAISPENSFTNRIEQLIETNKDFIDPKQMGFPNEWEKNSNWRLWNS